MEALASLKPTAYRESTISWGAGYINPRISTISWGAGYINSSIGRNWGVMHPFPSLCHLHQSGNKMGFKSTSKHRRSPYSWLPGPSVSSHQIQHHWKQSTSWSSAERVPALRQHSHTWLSMSKKDGNPNRRPGESGLSVCRLLAWPN